MLNKELLDLAFKEANNSNCLRRKTGAILVKGDKLIMSASNGTPDNTLPCNEGGCPRCSSGIPQLQGYDICACVHAEVNLIAKAAKKGIPTEGTTVYCTLRPCLGCLKMMIQAGVKRVIFNDSYTLDPELEQVWWRITNEAGIAMIWEKNKLPK